jgi:two-component system response regulator FixJ
MTIALIDDDAAVLDSLGRLLRNRGMTVECFSSTQDFLMKSQSMALTCVVSDIRMPGLSGLDLQSELIRRGSAVPLILITGHGDIAMAVRAIKRGAFDFIEKPLDAGKLAESIRNAVAHGNMKRSRDEEIAGTVARVAALPGRQREVLQLVAKGLSNKEIALQLGISPRTVENYRAWVMEKMGANNLAELVRMVVQMESITGAEPKAGCEQ